LGVPSSRVIVFVSATKNAAARPKVAPELRPGHHHRLQGHPDPQAAHMAQQSALNDPGKKHDDVDPAPGARTGNEPGEHVLRSDREITWSDGGRSSGRALLQRLQRQPDGGVELGIAPRCPVVRRDCHLDVRIHAVVLQRPADASKPIGVLRLRRYGNGTIRSASPIDKAMACQTTSAPGPAIGRHEGLGSRAHSRNEAAHRAPNLSEFMIARPATSRR
jgi:hypothetical protein